MEVNVTQEGVVRVAALPHLGPYHEIGATFGKLAGVCGPAGLFTPSAVMVGIYHDDPETTPPADLRSDAAITIDESAQVPDALNVLVIASGKYARTTHIGSYSGLPGVWGRLKHEWLPKSGERVADSPCYEVYRNDPTDTPEEKLHTDIYLPLVE